jgi:hypothetical protein
MFRKGHKFPDGRMVIGIRCGRCGDLLIRDAAPVGVQAPARSACGYVLDNREMTEIRAILSEAAPSLVG